MSDGVVVLPKAVEEVVGERGDGRNRFCSARSHRGHGLGCQGEGIATIDHQRIAHGLPVRSSRARPCKSPVVIERKKASLHYSLLRKIVNLQDESLAHRKAEACD